MNKEIIVNKDNTMIHHDIISHWYNAFGTTICKKGNKYVWNLILSKITNNCSYTTWKTIIGVCLNSKCEETIKNGIECFVDDGGGYAFT